MKDTERRVIVRRTRPARRRRHGPRRKAPRAPGRLPRPPAPVQLSGPRGGNLVDWPHLLVNGSDAALRDMLRGLAALLRRLDAVHDYAGRGDGLSGADLEVLLTVADGDGAAEGGLAQTALAARLGGSPYWASEVATGLARRGLIDKRPEPGPGRRKRLHLTDAARAAIGRAAPLLRGAYNLAFAPLNGRDFATLCRVTAALDNSSAHAAEIAARHAGAAPPQAIAELRRAMKRLGGK